MVVCEDAMQNSVASQSSCYNDVSWNRASQKIDHHKKVARRQHRGAPIEGSGLIQIHHEVTVMFLNIERITVVTKQALSQQERVPKEVVFRSIPLEQL
jgi:hypothetical protein